jgi:sugar phosphate isomerase/epimerase
MYTCLSPWAIGVQANSLDQALAAARTGGFAGLEISVGQVADLIDHEGADAARRKFADAGIRPAAFGLPVEWRQDEARFRADLDNLPRYAKAAQALGVTRSATWVLPMSNARARDENIRFHIGRFTPIARILAEHDIRLGLEFIGPRTLRETQKHPFIWKMFDMLDLARKIGPNVGLLVDVWHLYTSHGTLDDFRKLQADDVVYVHVNDAPPGIDVDQQIDTVRDLPGATGVIDIVGFLQALRQIGYAGPVTPEPFKKELADLPNDEARLKKVGAAMDSIFAKAGLAKSATSA